MKQTILVLALLTAFNANATNYGNPLQGSVSHSNSESIAIQHQYQNSSSSAQGGSVGAISNSSSGGNSSVSVDNDTKMPASSAISPSVGTSNDCLIATPSSKAFSVLIFSASGTTGVTYNDLCFAYKMKQYDIAEQLMCAKSQDYAKANKNCK